MAWVVMDVQCSLMVSEGYLTAPIPQKSYCSKNAKEIGRTVYTQGIIASCVWGCVVSVHAESCPL